MAQDMSHILQTTTDGKLDVVSPRSHVEDLMKRALASGRPLVLHLHGGLVPEKSAYEMVNRLQLAYWDAGLFPIFVVWRTGLLDALKNAGEIVHRPLFQKLLVRLLKFLVSRYGGLDGKALGAGQEPDDAEVEEELDKRNADQVPYEQVKPQPGQEGLTQSEEDALVNAVLADVPLREEWEKEVEAPAAPAPSAEASKSISLNVDVRDEALAEFAKPKGKALMSGALLAKYAIKITVRVVKRYFRHRDHGFHTTVVEEILRELYLDSIGTEVWQFMKQDAQDTFENEAGMPERGGWLLMKLLGEEAKKRHDAGQPLPVLSVVGHSAGTIYASHLLNYLHGARQSNGSVWHNLPFQVRRLVFLAPAITCKLFSETLKKHGQAALFETFRMFALTDKDERGYYEIKILYPASLLYMVSGLAEKEDDEGSGDMPLVGMQRYGRTDHPYDQDEVRHTWQFLRSKPHQMVWSGDDAQGPGLNCDTAKHGDFDNTPKTIGSFIAYLQQ